jgi:3-phytase
MIRSLSLCLSIASLALAPLCQAGASLPARAAEPVATGSASDVAVVPVDGEAVLFAAYAEAGLRAFAPDGRALGTLREAGTDFVEPLPGQSPRLAALAVASGELQLLAVEGSAATPRVRAVGGIAIRLDDEATGLCAYASPLDGTTYLFISTDAGLVEQWALREAPAGIAGVRVRSIAVGKGIGACVVDPRTRTVYVTDESMGLWRFGAEPETDVAREPVALAEPFGPLGEESKGVTIAADATGARWLLVAEASASRLHVLSLPELRHAGALPVDGLGEAEGIAVGSGLDAIVAIADESEDQHGTRLRLLAWRDVAAALALAPAAGDSGVEAAKPLAVRPDRETEPVQSFGDAADDAEIWVHPRDPARSLVITAQKKQGLHVYDLEGRTVQVLPDGRMNNVDLRGDIVAATNRSDDTLTLYRVDADRGRLQRLEGQSIDTGFVDPYGVCLYRSARDGALYVFANDAQDGNMRQWRLHEERGRVRAEPVREWRMPSLAEACVADDAHGQLYVGEEDAGLWRFGAEPEAATRGVLVDRVGEGRLVADVEGISIYAGADGGGYLVVSSQGSDDYVLFEREGANRFVGRFHVVADPVQGIDGASETDGLAVSAAALGPRYPRGLLVVQDGRNLPRERQNFKYVPWDRIEALIGAH